MNRGLPISGLMGAGWQIFQNKNRDLSIHGGDNDGFHCCAVASVERKSGFDVITNGDNGPGILKNLIMGSMQEFLAANYA